MFREHGGRQETGKELAEVTILLSYLVMSLVCSCAFLWVLLHRGSRPPRNDAQRDWDSM